MTTLHCDHRMNLPCDTVTVLMVITCALIYVINYCIRTYNYNPVYLSLHNICPHLLRYAVHTMVWLVQLIHCIYVCLYRHDPNTIAY